MKKMKNLGLSYFVRLTIPEINNNIKIVKFVCLEFMK